MIKAVIFDYNGTLFFDADINYDAWKMIYKEIIGNDNGFDDFYIEYGKTNTVMVEALYKKVNKSYDKKIIDEVSIRKESYYHKICRERKRDSLANGVEDLLDYLLSSGIKVNICTASIKYNVDFYYENTNIGKYFDVNKVAYDNGTIQNKVELYKLACKNVGEDPCDCLVFDDSKHSIEDAISAGIEKVIRINHYGDSPIHKKEVLLEAKDFTEIDYSLFNRL